MNETIQALTIAGFDSGGGAGMQADLKTFQEREVFGTSVLTALPIQNTMGVKKIYDLPLQAISDQLEVIKEDFAINATKTGMLFTAEIIELVADFLARADFGQLVVDPVMIAKGGAALLQESAVTSLCQRLLPLATVITPNIPEAEVITGMAIETEADMLEAASRVQSLGVKHALIKGGHRIVGDTAKDLLLTQEGTRHWFETPRIATKNTHGTGCTFSACLTAELAKGTDIEAAVATSKAFIQAAIADQLSVGHGNGPTNHWAYRKAGTHV